MCMFPAQNPPTLPALYQRVSRGSFWYDGLGDIPVFGIYVGTRSAVRATEKITLVEVACSLVDEGFARQLVYRRAALFCIAVVRPT